MNTKIEIKNSLTGANTQIQQDVYYEAIYGNSPVPFSPDERVAIADAARSLERNSLTNQTVWALRDLDSPLEINLVDALIFLENREALKNLLPAPSHWYLLQIERHFEQGGGPLQLVPQNQQERALTACLGDGWGRILFRRGK